MSKPAASQPLVPSIPPPIIPGFIACAPRRRSPAPITFLFPRAGSVADGELSAADLAAVRLLDELLVTAGSSGDYVVSSACMQPTLDLIKTAVQDGELDAAMEAASGRVRAGFAK